MSIFDLVTKYRKAVMIGLFVLIIPPFALFGIDQYFRDGATGQTVAVVGDYEISEQEFQLALRERQEQLRSMSGGHIDPALLDSPELRFSVLEGLVRQRLLIRQGLKSGMTVSPEQLRAYITQAPIFRGDDGQFSIARYEQFLKGQNQSAAAFENRVRQDLILTQVADAYQQSSFVPRTVSERLYRITEQQREVSRAEISPDRFVASVKLEDDAARKYYDGQQDEFRVPEQVRVEYVALSLESLLPQIQIDAAEVKKYYDEHQRQYGVPESRQASHILIAVDKTAGPDAKEQARAKAEPIAAEAKKNPNSFAELAKKHSQDPGSAANGGELGTFSRGSMVKAFDEAVFGMKVGDISAPVETEYGYHIIRLTGITPAQMKSLEQARPEIEKEAKKQRAGRRFAELAEQFNNVVFEQSDSLKPAAELVKQAPQTSGWITRSGADDARLNNPKLLQAIFAEDVLVNKRNTEAIEIAPGTIVAARVVEHKPSVVQSFDAVKAAIEKKVVQQRANQLAAQEGRQQLEQLRQGKDVQTTWSTPQLVSRADPKGFTEPILRQVFKADAAHLPAYAGVEAPGGGYMLLKVTRVVEPQKVDVAQQKQLAEALSQMVGEEHFAAYVASLKSKAKVSINKEKFEKP
ncbi:MAG: SurA N-terminal domain-containing protein [Burkholderiales bacterium]